MKQKLLAAFTALALCFSMTACHVSTPASVGSIGEVDISAGIYLISQFQAYQTVLGYANATQSEMNTAAFLKESVYLAEDGTKAPEPQEGEEQTGEARSVRAFIESETLKNLEYYAAVESMFAELGGTLTEEEIASADGYAAQLWEQYADLYESNGIGLATIKAYQYTSMKQNAILSLLYGTDGTEPVSDAALTAFLNDDMVYATYLSVPMYNTTDYTFADADQQAEILAVLEDIADDFNTAMADDNDADAGDILLTALQSDAAAAYEVTGSPFDNSTLLSNLKTDLYGKSTLADYFSEDALATITALGTNEAAAFQADYTSAMLFVRGDAFASGYALDDLRTTILMEMKNDTLISLIEETGASLGHNLDAGAMAKFPTKKVASK